MRLRQLEYSDADLAAWAARIADAGWADVFAYFKHDQDAHGPALANRFRALLEGGDASVAASV